MTILILFGWVQFRMWLTIETEGTSSIQSPSTVSQGIQHKKAFEILKILPEGVVFLAFWKQARALWALYLRSCIFWWLDCGKTETLLWGIIVSPDQMPLCLCWTHHSLQICLKHLHEMKLKTFSECGESKHTQMNFYFLWTVQPTTLDSLWHLLVLILIWFYTPPL